MLVTLNHTKLSIDLPKEKVFIVKEEDGQEIRYYAWDIVRSLKEDDNVYRAVTADGRLCYIVLSLQEYDPSYPPKVAKTREQDERESERTLLAAEGMKRTLRRHIRQEKIKSKYQLLPKVFSGVEWGSQGRVLVRTKDKMVVYRPGASSWAGRGSGPTYMKAHVTIHSYESDKDAIYFTSKIGGALGFDIELPDKRRFCPKGINAIRPLLAKALGLSILSFDDWHGEKTLVLH